MLKKLLILALVAAGQLNVITAQENQVGQVFGIINNMVGVMIDMVVTLGPMLGLVVNIITPPEGEETEPIFVMSLSDAVPIECPNEGELLCTMATLEGDWVGTAMYRFDQFEFDENNITAPGAVVGSYSGEVDLDLTSSATGEGGSTTGFVPGGVITVLEFTADGDVIFDINASLNTIGGTGYFDNRDCQTTNTGTLQLGRTPWAEVLDLVGECTIYD